MRARIRVFSKLAFKSGGLADAQLRLGAIIAADQFPISSINLDARVRAGRINYVDADFEVAECARESRKQRSVSGIIGEGTPCYSRKNSFAN